MNKSDSIVKIVPALLKAQKAMGAASKDSKNPYFKSSYADYGSVLEASKEPLNSNGILVLQPHSNKEGKNFVDTLLIHESGEYISSSTEVVCSKPNDPQALGSAITYARRYGLQSILSMPTEDDDGEKAMVRQPKTPIAAKLTETATTAPTPTVNTKPVTTETPSVTKTPGFKPGKPIEAPKANGTAKSQDW